MLQGRLDFVNGAIAEKGLLVRNRGLLPLQVWDAHIDEDVAVQPKTLTVPPGGVDLITVTPKVPGHTAPATHLSLSTNDPDANQSPFL